MFNVCASVGYLFYPCLSPALIAAGAAGAVAADAPGFIVGFVLPYFLDLGMRFPLWFVAVVVGREVVVYGLYIAVLRRKRRIEHKPSALAKWNTLLLAVYVLALLLLHFSYSWVLWAVATLTTLVTGAQNAVAALGAIRVRVR